MLLHWPRLKKRQSKNWALSVRLCSLLVTDFCVEYIRKMESDRSKKSDNITKTVYRVLHKQSSPDKMKKLRKFSAQNVRLLKQSFLTSSTTGERVRIQSTVGLLKSFYTQLKTTRGTSVAYKRTVLAKIRLNLIEIIPIKFNLYSVRYKVICQSIQTLMESFP